MLAIGSAAPDFSLRSTTGDTISLASLRGEPATLVFIPFAFTGVCQGELCELRDDLAMFEGKGKVLVITCDPAPTQKRWAEEQGFTFPLLADFWPHGAVASAYDVFNEQLGCADRGTYVLDAEGTVVAAFESGALGTPRAKADYEKALAAVG